MLREAVFCLACPDPDTAFQVENVGMTFQTKGDYHAGDSVMFTASRPLWETVMLDHLRMTDDDTHQQLYGQCVAVLLAEGTSAERLARRQVQAVVDFARQAMYEMHEAQRRQL